MSILDTFFILFESDASKLDKGLQDSRKKAKGLERDLTDADKAAFELGSSIGKAVREFAGIALAALSIHEMVQAIGEAATHADKLDETAERLDINIELLSAWGDLTKKSGGSVEAFAGSIEALNKGLSMLEVTGKSRVAPFLKELGIDMDAAANKGKNAMDFLPMIAEAFEGMEKQKSNAIGQKLGLDQGTIMTLQQGRREVEALLLKERELGVVTKEQGEIAAKFKDQQDDTNHAFRSMWTAVATAVLPAITAILKAFEGLALFMRKHSDFIVGLMIAIGSAIAVFVVPSLLSAAAAAIVALAPFLLIGAAVAAVATGFALLYDDVMNFIDGNDSLIGQILTEYPAIKDVILAVVGAVTAAFQTMGSIIGFVWDGMTDRVKAFIEFVMSAVALVKGVVGAIGGALGAVGGFIQKVYAPDSYAAAQQQLGDTNTPLAATSSSAISNSRGGDKTTNVNVGKVEVKTAATDADGIARSVGGSLKSEMRGAVDQFDNGVAM